MRLAIATVSVVLNARCGNVGGLLGAKRVESCMEDGMSKYV
jgi:hypothetical protein